MDPAATPPDLAAALKKAGLAEFFAGCTPAHRREYLQWVGEAKKPETRAKRIGQAAELIGAKAAAEARRRK